MTEQRQPPDESPSLWDDPVVEEVRAVRRQLWDQSGRDIRRFIERSRQAAERRRTAKLGQDRNAG